MSFPPQTELLHNRILTVLSFPLMERLQELSIMFERCTARQIQEIYPMIVHSIFGINGNALGWGLRTTTIENGPHYFNALHQFFGVTGPFMNICHRLLNETTKFAIDISLLPSKFVNMLNNQSSAFYSDLINIDPFQRQANTLSLNAFDFYILHFVLYALQPLHCINPIAMQVHNERTKTVYLLLVTEYLDNFLPLHPDVLIQPANFCNTVKAPQPLPTPLLQPQRKPRYLRIPTNYGNGNIGTSGSGGGNTSPQSGGSAARALSWRSESVVHFFIDIWLRYDIEAERHLPSSDFVRGVRVLIKQIHFFANGVHLDHGSLCLLRKVSLTMVKARIYAFLCSLIERWPLDCSLVVVLELWLSYIQPWRYTIAAANHRVGGINYEPPILPSFDNFIMENIIVYTHIFMLLLPRFERLDYTVYRNAHMLFRLSKTFAQQDLGDRLQRFEQVGSTFGFDSPQRQIKLISNSPNSNVSWISLGGSQSPKLFSREMHAQIENFLFIISMARNTVLREIGTIRNEIAKRQRSEGFIKNLLSKLMAAPSQEELTLKEISRIPELLRQGINSFCNIFNVDPGNLSMHESLPPEPPSPQEQTEQFSFFDMSDSLDTSKLTPSKMALNASKIRATVDPALLPLQSNEIRPLTHLLHFVSENINAKFGSSIESCYSREDFCGKVARQLLCAPMTEQWFDRKCGNTSICEKQLPPRVCLRPLASIPVLFTIVCSLILGHWVWGAPTMGLMGLCFMFLIYVLLQALIS
ncbi:sphingomyelin phosphodiesterase 4 isoform X2 [Scaptodrosophila lebanonensis]|uniref:Sphingomyelin phosphodiesterase 4 isoform X2 n=1 Tax=Drosophila lebanonensis TaxID=7225 RepID=A0A6J2TL28_DROLE|nr:sphingomyelin phosphodiesterase 4 isoform X2 [Scaptodrosophila lebanonensis]